MPFELERNKPIALVQLDCDGEWSFSNQHGGTSHHCGDIMHSTITRFLDIFKMNNIKSTLFVVGKDIEDQKYRECIVQAMENGHELANHTYNHPVTFLQLNKEEKISEIMRAQDIFLNYFGKVAQGFRAPNFALNEELIDILSELGFTYDSSMLPTILNPVVRTIKKQLNYCFKNDVKEVGYLGRGAFHFAPRMPFIPSINSVWRRQKNTQKITDLFEVPVMVSPFLKLPCHASYALAYPTILRNLLTRWTIRWHANKKIPFVYVFHLNDLCESEYLHNAEFQFFGKIEERLNFVNWICSEINKYFNSITTMDLIQQSAIKKKSIIR